LPRRVRAVVVRGSDWAPLRSGGGAPTQTPMAACEPGHALSRRSTRLGCDWGWLGVLAGVRFRTGAVLLHEMPAAACQPGYALNRWSTRPGCDRGWLGVLAWLRFRTGAVLLQEIPTAACRRGTL